MKPGEMVKMIADFIMVDEASCDCNTWIAKMDAWGVDGCREHVEEIVRWVVNESRGRGFPASETPQFRKIAKATILHLLDCSEAYLDAAAVVEAAGIDINDPAMNPDGVNMGGDDRLPPDPVSSEETDKPDPPEATSSLGGGLGTGG